MKTNIITLIILLCFTFQLSSQNLNQEITKEEETPYLLGAINKSSLKGEKFTSWFTKNYDNYKPNETITYEIESDLKNYSIKLFMGTWCRDSRQEVPKIYKVLEACNFPMNQLTVIAVGRKPNMYKQSPQHEEAGLNIHRVPTVIFYKDEKEVNRIVEHPVESFEEDFKNIITLNNYKSNYQIVTAIDKILKKKGIKGLKKNNTKLLKSYKGKVTSMLELNTYAKILYGSNRIDEAIEVFIFNTKLFPYQARTYMSLANTVAINGNPKKGIEILKKAIELFPENEGLIQNLENLETKL